MPVKIKYFQTVPNETKIALKIGIESTVCNYDVFGFSKYWTENPRVGSSILSLGTIISGTYEIFVGAFFVLTVTKMGTIPTGFQFNLLI